MELYPNPCHLLVSILEMLRFTDIGITDGVVPLPLPPAGVDSKYSWDPSILFTDIGITDGVVPPPPPAGVDSKYS